MRKRRTREHILADLSVNHVERFVLLCGHTVDRIIFDYGYDLVLRTFDSNGEVEPGFLFVQLKASDHPDYIQSSRYISVRVDSRDWDVWRTEKVPVILVIYDAEKDTAYWVHVQSLPAMDRQSVRIPTEQRVTKDGIDAMRMIKVQSQKGLPDDSDSGRT